MHHLFTRISVFHGGYVCADCGCRETSETRPGGSKAVCLVRISRKKRLSLHGAEAQPKPWLHLIDDGDGIRLHGMGVAV